MKSFLSLHAYLAQLPEVNLFKNILSATGNYTAGFSGHALLLS